MPHAPAPVDHLVYAAPDLARGMAEIERRTGIAPAPGGQHPGRGTHNALLALGDDAYLEIVAPDSAQPAPAAARWLGVDAVAAPRLTTWAARGRDLEALHRRAAARGVPLGALRTGARDRADGVRLSWRLTDPEPLVADGLVPFFIDWGDSPHPSASAPRGVTLVALRPEHPDVERVRPMLHAVGLDVPLVRAAVPGLVAVLDTPNGRVELR